MKARPLRKHILVCTNERPDGHPRGCCLASGSDEILKALKERVKTDGLRVDVRAQRAGCLDTCEFGPSVVVYPDNVWYQKVQLSDVDEIIDSHIKGEQPVERLLMPGK